MTTASAAETEVDRTAPTHRRHDDAIVSATLSAAQTDTSFGFFVELRTLRHVELGGEYTDNSVLPKRFAPECNKLPSIRCGGDGFGRIGKTVSHGLQIAQCVGDLRLDVWREGFQFRRPHVAAIRARQLARKYAHG